MSLSPIERILLIATVLTVAYRAVYDRWPVGVEVEPE